MLLPADSAIGYMAIILVGFSLHFMSHHSRYCTLIYGISCLLGAVDGQAHTHLYSVGCSQPSQIMPNMQYLLDKQLLRLVSVVRSFASTAMANHQWDPAAFKVFSDIHCHNALTLAHTVR